MNTKRLLRAFCVSITAATLLTACASPMERDAQEAMRDQMLSSHRQYVTAAASGPVIELSRPPSEVEAGLSQERRDQLDAMSGVRSYESQTPKLGADLLGGREDNVVRLTLEQAVAAAVKNNLDVQLARLRPAISQTQITQADAAFDAVVFADFSLSRLDTPRPPSTVAGALGAAFGGNRQTENDSLTTGIRKRLSTGGTVSASTSLARNWEEPQTTSLKEYETANIELGITQPLLRGFGPDVNRAEIILARSARQTSVQDLRRDLLDTVLNVERAYWNLYFSRNRLLIQERLLERTSDDYSRIQKRQDFDVSPVRTTEAGSFVELRRGEVIRARQDVRTASDALKRLINSANLPISGETLIIPADAPADVAVKFSLLDAVTTALRQRPEMQAALQQIHDAAIRLRVADNAKLPQLNVSAVMRFNGLGSSVGGAYDQLTDGDFIDYILGAQFEMPIGNRGPSALYAQRNLERRTSVVAYQRAAQEVVLQVKDAMRTLLTSYELIGAARAARRAAADNLRAIEQQEEAGVALTPEFLLDLKLSSQQRLATAETQELQALVDYNTAIAAYYRALGTLLERNGIAFESDPDGRD